MLTFALLVKSNCGLNCWCYSMNNGCLLKQWCQIVRLVIIVFIAMCLQLKKCPVSFKNVTLWCTSFNILLSKMRKYAYWITKFVWGRITCVWIAIFLKEIFLLKNKTDRKILTIQNWLFVSYILENEWSELSFQEK